MEKSQSYPLVGHSEQMVMAAFEIQTTLAAQKLQEVVKHIVPGQPDYSVMTASMLSEFLKSLKVMPYKENGTIVLKLVGDVDIIFPGRR